MKGTFTQRAGVCRARRDVSRLSLLTSMGHQSQGTFCECCSLELCKRPALRHRISLCQTLSCISVITPKMLVLHILSLHVCLLIDCELPMGKQSLSLISLSPAFSTESAI